jgi:hypothetical protein
MFLPAVVLDAVGVDFVQFFVLFNEGKLAAFASVDVLEGFVDGLAAYLSFHKVLDVRGFVFVGEFDRDEVDLFGREEGRKLFGFGEGAEFFENPQNALFPDIISQSQTELEDFSFGGINFGDDFSEGFNLCLFVLKFLPHTVDLIFIRLILVVLELLHFENMLLSFDL